MLVGMVQLQTGKMRVTEFVDERSKHLSDIAAQAKEEYDKIAQDAMRNLDEAGSKVPNIFFWQFLEFNVPIFLGQVVSLGYS